MKRFEIGKTYGAYDTGTPPIEILARTAKTVTAKDTEIGSVFTMRIKEYNGHEFCTDSSVPKAWRECYTYSTQFEI